MVKASSNVPDATQGYDAGKRTKGRKQNIATDTLGHPVGAFGSKSACRPGQIQ